MFTFAELTRRSRGDIWFPSIRVGRTQKSTNAMDLKARCSYVDLRDLDSPKTSSAFIKAWNLKASTGSSFRCATDFMTMVQGEMIEPI
jgi:hypothetical protein